MCFPFLRCPGLKAPSEIYRLHLDPFSYIFLVSCGVSFQLRFRKVLDKICCVLGSFKCQFGAAVRSLSVNKLRFSRKGGTLDFERPYSVLA